MDALLGAGASGEYMSRKKRVYKWMTKIDNHHRTRLTFPQFVPIRYEGVFGRQTNAVIKEKKIPPTAMFNQLSTRYERLALNQAHVKDGMIPINRAMIDSRINNSDFLGNDGSRCGSF